ncbi:MAG: hypothetical protein AABX54_05560 [Nanoarchaeota archaeon]
MAVLERVMQMKQEGVTEPEIIGALRQEGVSPLEINEALSQAKIKSALDSNPESSMGMEGNFEMGRSQFGSMEQSMMQPQENMEYGGAQPQGYMNSLPEGGFETGEEGEGFQEFQNYSPEVQGYPEYQPRPAIDIETINEICEQTFEEKTEKLKKEISSFSKFKEEINFEVQKISERLKKMENSFNEIQMSILRRVGDYGEDIKNISREMHATQESFSKMINPVIDKARGAHSSGSSGETGNTEESHEHSTHHTHPHASHTGDHASATHHTPHSAHKKHKPGFESYLR